MQELKGRLNVMRSDFAFAALFGEDVMPARRHMFHVSALPPGTSAYQLQSAAATLDLGWPRAKMEARPAAGRTSGHNCLGCSLCPASAVRPDTSFSMLSLGMSAHLQPAAAPLKVGWSLPRWSMPPEGQSAACWT